MSPIKFHPNIDRVVSPQCQSKRTNPREVTDAEVKDTRGKKSHTTRFSFMCHVSSERERLWLSTISCLSLL